MRRAADVVINIVLVAVLLCICVRVLFSDLTKDAQRGLTLLSKVTKRWVTTARSLITDHRSQKD